MLRTMRIVVAVAVAACLVLAPTATSVVPAAGIGDAAKLRKAVNVQGMKKHEQAFQNIANANGGTRSSGRRASTRRSSTSSASSWRPATTRRCRRSTSRSSRRPRPRPSSASRRARRRTSLTDEFATMTYSGSGDVTAQLQEVDDNQFPPGPDAELVERAAARRPTSPASRRAASR